MQYIKKLHEQLRKSEKEFHDIFDDYKQISIEKDEFIMQQTTVLAMTTTTAARYRESLSKVGPLITIIEEAAEVPEAHIVTAISPRCKHLILIGDHKQLQPKPAVHELAIKFNLSVSLFERMVKNNLSYHCLQRQHRMRPEISELVRHIYHTLYDNENVYEYPSVKGIRKSVFFITHNKIEVFKDEGRSFSNEYEAEYLKELYLYLLKQRYKPSDITIITAYAGQMTCLEEKLPSSKFKGVKICVLDNYQGEENEIILLSLVRSNTTGDIGFLNRENRICVALSRARQGLFIIGNSDTLTKKSQHWQTVIGKLQIQENVNDIDETSPKYPSLGKALPLYCQNHPKKEGILAESPSDFKKVKDGGCDLPCEFELSCGHACRYDCHPFDREHKSYKCKIQCSETCAEGHKCFKRCHYDDDCRCSVEMARELKCQHIIVLQCHVHYSKYPCPIKVTRTLLCGHIATMECYVDPNNVLCKVSVDRKLECGHTARLNCHVDPNRHECTVVLTETRSKCGHEFERRCHDANYERLNECRVLINEKRTSCDHVIERHCFDTTYEMRIECSITVTMNRSSCGHEYQRQCHDQLYEMRHECNDMVQEQCLSCKHYYKRHCFDPDFVQRHTCQNKIVEKRDNCGHKYVRNCSDTNYQHEHKCSVYVEKKVPRCDHKIKLPCHQDVSSHKCREIVTKKLECKHYNTHECCNIDSIKCNNKCNKICINGHVCTNSCHFPTSCDCMELIETILEGCKHKQSIPCSIDPKVYPCETMVKKVLNKCHHSQDMECHIDPETVRCKFAVLKSLPECGHEEKVLCSENLSGVKCTKKVKIKLEKCGHSVGIKCWQKRYMSLQEVKCFEPTIHTRSDCGHITTIPCWEISSNTFTPCQKLLDTTLSCGHVIKSVCSMEEEKMCDKKCEKPLSCGHPCPGLCHECDHNQDCSCQCEKEFVCGHACPCEVCMMCTPCQNSCSFECSHSKCPSQCIDSCNPCKENCSWKCEHYKCTKLCFEECNRQRCCNNCDRTLSCGHQCPGYCGEPCPLFCADCKPEMYVLKDTSKDKKIVTLVQCGHSIGSIYLDECMDEMKNHLVSRCPCCRAIISFHPRYERILKRQKMALEDAKLKIRKVRVNSQTIYPACDAEMLTSFEQYTTSIATYLHIIQQTRRKNEFDQEFHDTEKLAESILKDIETTPATSFKTCLQLSEKIFSLYIQWILCLFTTKPELMGKFYIADWFPALKKSTSNILNDFLPELVESLENIFEENDRISTDTNGHRIIISHDIVVIVRLLEKHLNQEQITEILRPFIEDMKGDGYLANTRIYPQLHNVVGIHSSDWTICRNGHTVSTILDYSCNICDGPDNQQTEFRYDDGQNVVTHGLTKARRAQLGKSQVTNVRGKRSNFCKDKPADFSEDFGNMYSRPRVRNPIRNKSNSENFHGVRGQNLRGRGKSTEKAMRAKTTNEETRKSYKKDKMHSLPSLKSDDERYHNKDGKDKHNLKENKQRFPNNAPATGRENNKSDSNGADSGVSEHVLGHEDIIDHVDGNVSRGSRRAELNRGGHRDHYHYRGSPGRGRGRGGNMEEKSIDVILCKRSEIIFTETVL
ncbi:NFX1-type zinc finger-containing protein 1 [Mytilus coruscus]|uniref:NFX1-type zinc finger-containing protein 1 n=1 Tax=Mytilus coruscus TaxID=42192 RepID=A0A6J8AAR8_MYTCO|nr:NFX1-type zinc finger-containing protein 1 [Mytilus coruscus]